MSESPVHSNGSSDQFSEEAFMCAIVANGHDIKQYYCAWITNGIPCNTPVLGRDVPEHLRIVHGVGEPQRLQCRWGQCGDDLSRACVIRHVQEKHLEFRWPCPRCYRIYTRQGLMLAHRADCPGE